MNDSPSTPVIPDHHVIRRIGEGAYGEIWLARNVIGTYRAVKIIYRRTFKDDRPYEREFSGIKKFEPISRTHPGLMDILQVGRNDAEGYFYYVMEVADDLTSGQRFHPDTYSPNTLSKQLAARGALPFDECLQIGLSLADGLAHLHQHGLIHRDIKPSNIIFVNGRAKLADIGLVADISAARTYVGTEGFIPPEGPGTAHADIYSLGKVLYETSTGKDRHLFPELPTLLGELPERDQFIELNEVIVKACAALPKDRHISANELHGELQMLVAGKSVKRLRLLERRLSRATRLAVVSAVLAILAGGVIYLVNSARQREQKLLAASYVTMAARAMDGGNFHAALPYFIEALRLQGGDRKASESYRVRIDSILRHSPALLQSWKEAGPVKDLQFTADGQRLLIGSGPQAVLRETSSGKILSLDCAMPKDIETVAFSPDEKQILVAVGSSVWISDETGVTQLAVPGGGNIYSARFSPDGSRIVVARMDRRAYVVDAKTGKEITTFKGHSNVVMGAEFSPDGQRIVTSSRDGTAQVWDAATGERIGPPLCHGSWVYDATFSPDGRRIVTASFNAVQVWDAASGKPLSQPMEHKKGIRHARLSPDQRFIASAGWDQRVCVWDWTSGKLALPLLNHDRPVKHAVFAPDGRRLATADDTGVVKIWDLESERPKELGKAIVSEDGSRYITYTTNSWQLWNARNDAPVAASVTITNRIDKVLVNRDATRVAVVSGPPAGTNGAMTVSVFDAVRRAALATFVPTQKPSLLALSADGKRFAAAVRRDLSVWDVGAGATGSPSRTLSHPHSVAHIAFSPDGTQIAATVGKEVHVWNVLTGRSVRDPLQHDRAVYRTCFTRDGSRLLTACKDGDTHPCSAQIWDLTTGTYCRWSLSPGGRNYRDEFKRR
jgi:WD40 repeat protein